MFFNFLNKLFRKTSPNVKKCGIYLCDYEIPNTFNRNYCDFHRENGFNGEPLVCSVCNKCARINSNGTNYCDLCYSLKNKEEIVKTIVKLWNQNIKNISSWEDMARMAVEEFS